MVPLGSSGELLDACAMIFKAAGDRPCVINLSLGQHAGEHTGRQLLEQALDHLVGVAPGRASVQSCGNYFQRRTHVSCRLRPGEVRNFHVEVDPYDATLDEVDLWYPGRDRLTVAVATGDGAHRTVVPLGEKDRHDQGAGRGSRLRPGLQSQQRRQPGSLYLDADRAVDGWEVTLVADDVVDGRVHARIERDTGCRSCQAHFAASDVDAATTLGTIANGFRTLAVGAYEPDRPPARFSSCGPTRDGRKNPDLVVPGVMVRGARSHSGRDEDGPGYVRMSGTSMAAPAVTGAVTLMFEAAGRPLAIEEIHKPLLASCDPPMPGTDPRSGRAVRPGREAVRDALGPDQRLVDVSLSINTCFLKRRNFLPVPWQAGHKSDAATPAFVVPPFAFGATTRRTRSGRQCGHCCPLRPGWRAGGRETRGLLPPPDTRWDLVPGRGHGMRRSPPPSARHSCGRHGRPPGQRRITGVRQYLIDTPGRGSRRRRGGDRRREACSGDGPSEERQSGAHPAPGRRRNGCITRCRAGVVWVPGGQ